MKSCPHFEIENTYWQKGYTVLGIDEVGRGCLAGPITVGLTAYPAGLTIRKQKQILTFGINDSKKLSPAKRKQLINLINHHTFFTTTASSSVDLINTRGIEYALHSAISEAVKRFILEYPDNKILLLVDGRVIAHIPYINDIERNHIIGGDGISISIASASIIAKVARDQYMENLSGHELYSWEQNKGYGTKKHREAIITHGLSEQHRRLFVRKILSSDPNV